MRFIGLLMVAGVIGFSHSAEAQEWEVHEGHAVKGNGTNAPKLVAVSPTPKAKSILKTKAYNKIGSE